MKVAALVVTWNGQTLVGPCLTSLLEQDPRPTILVVDNASSDGTVAVARGLAAAAGATVDLVVTAANLGFTRGANLGLERLLASAMPPDAVLLVNQDAVVRPGGLAAATAVLAEDERVGAVGFKIFYPDGHTLQHAGGVVTEPRLVGQHLGHHQADDGELFAELREVDYVTAAVALLRSAALDEVGLFDEVYSPGFYEDVDLCWRLRERGWKVVFAPAAQATHQESASFSNWQQRWTLSHRNRLLFALRRLADPALAPAFMAAEVAHIAGCSDATELRILAQAAFQALLLLDRAATGGRSFRVESRVGLDALRACLADLRNRCLVALHGRLVAR